MQQQPYEVARVRAYESAGLSRTRLVIAVDRWELARLRDYEVTRLRGSLVADPWRGEVEAYAQVGIMET